MPLFPSYIHICYYYEIIQVRNCFVCLSVKDSLKMSSLQLGSTKWLLICMRAYFQLSPENVFFCGVPPLGHHFSECFRCCLNDASDDMSSVPYFPDGHKSARRRVKICDGVTFHLRKRVNYFLCRLEYLIWWSTMQCLFIMGSMNLKCVWALNNLFI